MIKGEHWEASALADALKTCEEAQAGQITLLSGEQTAVGAPSDALHLRLHGFGDLDVVVAVVRPAILASIVLCKTSDVPRQADFEHGLLKAHKLMPLSMFAITTIGGEEYYEIVGQLSTGSELEEIIEEIETLGRNAIEAAEMIETWKKGQ
jgi:uncharacterized protein YjfI (DUF2170 family)